MGVTDQTAPCQHERVRHAPRYHADGTQSDRWLCEECLSEFIPRAEYDRLITPTEDTK